MLPLKQRAFLNLKNAVGWSTKRKIVVFSVDDYGNIRLASKKARNSLVKAGIDLNKNRFDLYDSLETTEDLSMLFDVLDCVKDKNNKPAKFTAYALSANIDFEKVQKSNDHQYHYEVLPDTFDRLPGYEGTWELWNEGVKKGFLDPQYHGREHLNIRYFEHALKNNDPIALKCLEFQSWAGLNRNTFSHINYVSAFAFETQEEIASIQQLALEGLATFEKVFGKQAQAFTAPGGYTHHEVEQYLGKGGIDFIDTAFIKHEHQGAGKYKYRLNVSGKTNKAGQINLVRNSVFEPSQNYHLDWVDRCLYEIANAFKHGKAANISSHRVNFCGHIDPNNRANGLKKLEKLLKSIVKKWPDVEFMSSVELGALTKAT